MFFYILFIMKININHNDFKSEIIIDISKKIGIIQEEILNLCSLIIYNIEKTEIFINNKSYILGIEDALFNINFDVFLNNNNLINEKIDKIIIYDRERDCNGNVIKKNDVINNYNEWYKIYQNENYINYLNRNDIYNSNINQIEIPFNLFLENIFRIPILEEFKEEESKEEESKEEEFKEEEFKEEESKEEYILENNQNLEEEIDLSFKFTLNNILDYDNNDIVKKEEIINIIDKKLKELEDENRNDINNINNTNEINSINDMNNIVNIFDNYIQNTNYSTLEENFFNILNRDINLNLNNYNTLSNLVLENDNTDNTDNIDNNTNNDYLNNLEYFNDIKIILDETKFNNLKCNYFKELSLNDYNECLICIDQFNDEDIVVKIKCNHFFHKNCIKSWLCEESNKCPICRIEVDIGIISDKNN